MKKLTPLFAAALLVAGGISNVHARASFQIINADGLNEGFNDPTPAAPVGGNAGTTVGQQRLIAFTFAAEIWSCILDSDVPIVVRAQFNPLTCTTTSGTLGSTGSQSIHRDFAGAPLAATWYVASQANALAGMDLNPGVQDMNSSFNSNLGTATCLPTSPWYYGLDENGPAGSTDLVTVLLHEFGHGLGFASTVNRTTGALNSSFIDVYSRHLYDNTQGLHWDAMTNAQRLASITNNNNLVWDGPAVNANGATNLCHEARLTVNSPVVLAGNYVAPLGSMSPCDPNVTADLALIVDNTVPTSDGCETITNNLAGKIAVVDRGTCTFVIKVLAAQNAGAIGVIVCNNAAGAPIEMGGSDPAITIPAVMVSQADGNAIKAEMLNGPVNATIGTNLAALAGADATGHMKMYAPNPSVSGSSTSHWDVSVRPNVLMEPSINADLDHTTDITVHLLKDIGWGFNAAPVAQCQDLHLLAANDCGAVDVAPSQVNNGSFDANGDVLTMTLTPAGPYAPGHNAVVFTVSDGCASSSCEADIFVECPVPVRLAAARVAWDGTEALLHWEVEDATDHAGFSVYRSAPGGETTRLTDRLLSGQTRYDYRDRTAPAFGADYFIVELSRSGKETWHGPIALAPASAPPATLTLARITPNPFLYQTRISYSLPKAGNTTVNVYDAQGRVVRHLVAGSQSSGDHQLTWDGSADNGSPAPAGIYFVKLVSGNAVQSQKVMLNR
ncbi:MAG TPA: PA domain-containing protein [Candidatus Eisenbacteria bacterium]